MGSVVEWWLVNVVNPYSVVLIDCLINNCKSEVGLSVDFFV